MIISSVIRTVCLVLQIENICILICGLKKTLPLSILSLSLPLIMYRVLGSLDPLPGKNLDEVANQHTFTHTGRFGITNPTTLHVVRFRRRRGGTDQAWREYANYTHRKRDSNPQPWRHKVTVQTINKPL